MHFLPQTKSGKWAALLIALWPLLTIIGFLLESSLYSGVEGGNGLIDDLRVRPIFAITVLTGIACGIISFNLNILAIIKKKERSVLSFIVALIGLFLITLLISEPFIEH